jgi:phospholipid/cholesterol/gamma-HCH transport system permease protein
MQLVGRVGRIAFDLTGAAGRRFLTRAGEFLDQFGLLWRVLKLVSTRGRGGKIIRQTTIEQIYFTGVQALPVVSLMALLLGVLVIVESTERLGDIGLEEFLGRVMVVMIIRELGPVMTALLVILRSGVAIGIKLGYMTALREMEAIEMQGVDPLHVVAVPRIIGLTSAIVCLFIYFDLVAVFGGSAFAWLVMGVPLGRLSWVVSRALSFSDVAIGLVKALFFGSTIGIVCVYRGMSARRELTAVAPQVSRAAVECLLWCLALDVIISAFFYL